MTAPTPDALPALLFTEARTFTRFLDRPIDDALIEQLYELVKWGPTSMNCQPARWVFVRSGEAKARLLPAVAPGNQAAVQAAPVTVIVALDRKFHEQLATQFPVHPGAGAMMQSNPAMAESTALRNSSLQGAYLICAARALGLDAGPMSGFDTAAVDAAFFPDGQWHANFLINLGWGDRATLRPRLPRLAFNDVARIA
jgi:3-hydroxypropanoate dehydrogenase